MMGLRLELKNRNLAGLVLVLAAGVGYCISVDAQTPPPQASVQIEFTNDKLFTRHWVLKLNEDGSGQFDEQHGPPPPGEPNQMLVGDVHQAIHLSAPFTAQVFTAARQHKLFAFACESHFKVAFQGIKRLSYSGPEGSGTCEYNYSKDKGIQSTGDSLIAVANTIEFGARLEKLLQHDHLGVDKETEDLASAVHDGNALEMGAIRPTLERIAGDEQILERARKRARLLLTQAR
jgi:hypothetical protein